jgi:hypothetical protein
MEVGPEKYGKCSEQTANAGGISWRYSRDARTEATTRVRIPNGISALFTRPGRAGGVGRGLRGRVT